MESLLKDAKLSVSSVLNRDGKQFGKQHMVDNDPITCWNSDQGSPQSVRVRLARPACLASLQLQFQGGFVGADCRLEVGTSAAQLRLLQKFYPHESNALQTFSIDEVHQPCTHVQLVFGASTDFYGRVTVYKLDLLGQWADDRLISDENSNNC